MKLNKRDIQHAYESGAFASAIRHAAGDLRWLLAEPKMTAEQWRMHVEAMVSRLSALPEQIETSAKAYAVRNEAAYTAEPAKWAGILTRVKVETEST